MATTAKNLVPKGGISISARNSESHPWQNMLTFPEAGGTRTRFASDSPVPHFVMSVEKGYRFISK